jgi:hypothetical protein
MSYFNTTNIVNPLLKNLENKAQSQEKKVLHIFRKSIKGLTASEIFRQYPERNTPLTSIRRAISNLHNDKLLERTPHKRVGIYGRTEFIYTIYTGQQKLFQS